MTKASFIMTRAGVQLLDEEHVRWPLAELADCIDEAVSAIALAKPSAVSVTMAFHCAVGTKQELPTDQRITSLLDVTRNLGTGGTTPGRMIRPTTRAMLDGQQPRWHDPASVPFKPEVRNFVFDENIPREFFVYPGNDGTGYVDIAVAQLPVRVNDQIAVDADPDDIASWDFEIGPDDVFESPILEYVLYRAFDKEDPSASMNRAGSHYQAFATALGIKAQVEQTVTPNRRK